MYRLPFSMQNWHMAKQEGEWHMGIKAAEF